MQSTWYYLDPKTGEMATGIKEIDGQRYGFKDSGAMKPAGNKDGKWYYFASSGQMEKDWLKDAGKWYYLNHNDGTMVTGLQEINESSIISINLEPWNRLGL